MTLTDKWKKGELPDGFYYVKLDDGRITLDCYDSGYGFYRTFELVEKVLTPIPTYQEYLESEVHCAVYSEVNKMLKEKNDNLRQLLKECRDYVVNTLVELMNGCYYEENDYYHETKTLLTKIDNAMGEK